jgi:hypothetical protein
MEMAYAKKIQLIKVGDLFPETRLEVPKDPTERMYLSLMEIDNFTLKEIKADLVIVEILSVYCPSCQPRGGCGFKSYHHLFYHL